MARLNADLASGRPPSGRPSIGSASGSLLGGLGSPPYAPGSPQGSGGSGGSSQTLSPIREGEPLGNGPTASGGGAAE